MEKLCLTNAKNNNNFPYEYYSNTFKDYNIILNFDPINRKRTDDDDNVMAIFYEEQPLMWEMFCDEIENTIKSCKGEIDFLDVGTGSGFWAIIVSKNINCNKILAIDKSGRAIKFAKKNIENNKIKNITLRKNYTLYIQHL